jgi:argininosuccinate lyase
MKLWQKDKASLKEVETFTSRQRSVKWICILAAFDVLGSLAHIQMLESVRLLTKMNLSQLRQELKIIYKQIEKGEFKLQG